jgi:hypothetical protein
MGMNMNDIYGLNVMYIYVMYIYVMFICYVYIYETYEEESTTLPPNRALWIIHGYEYE